MKFKLDFTIPTSKERLDAIRDIPLETLNKTELETVSNYILYGKDEDGTSIVDRKEIYIKTKFNSYQKNRTVSLEGLMESPTFDEKIFNQNRTIYKKVKPTIQRDQFKDIPDLVQLWKEIDKLEALLNSETLSQNEQYLLKHTLIELRTQQYQIVDCFRPQIGQHLNKAEFYEPQSVQNCSYPIFPRGVIKGPTDEAFMRPYIARGQEGSAAQLDETIKETGKPYFDFLNFDHVYQLILHYGDLKDSIRNKPDSLLSNLLQTLDFYIDKANLSDQQLLIVRDKKFKIPNKEIRQHLIDELGISHKENYISTIWNKTVKLIVAAAELNYDEWLCKDYQKAWKKCTRCGEWLLRDPRNFVRKSKAVDGLTSRCKKCDKEIRKINKGG